MSWFISESHFYTTHKSFITIPSYASVPYNNECDEGIERLNLDSGTIFLLLHSKVTVVHPFHGWPRMKVPICLWNSSECDAEDWQYKLKIDTSENHKLDLIDMLSQKETQTLWRAKIKAVLNNPTETRYLGNKTLRKSVPWSANLFHGKKSLKAKWHSALVHHWY